ncbi:MAG: MFS transporter [Bacteroidetes bacterium]|nr:MFS transporter [Bacteroidota bacterium]
MISDQKTTHQPTFSKYEIFIIAILAILQFSVILDFMVLSPLGYILLPILNIQPSQFGLVVSAYAFSAGASGLLAAGFADKFDRKKMLLFFYLGFILGTVFCALAPTYNFLLAARIVTGLFGGVIGSISFAIITDIFKMQVRGRVMGFVQTAFGASQVLGLPIGIVLAQKFGWHSPFWMISGISIVIWVAIYRYLKPVNDHLKIKSDRNAFEHLFKTISKPAYLRAFIATTLLATGGFMMMPFGSVFSTQNLKIAKENLPILFGITGLFSIIFGPIIGKFSDKIGKFKMFIIGSAITVSMVAIYTNLGPTPLALVILLNVILFVGISSRMISSMALLTSVPKPEDRGAFMSINSAVQQISGGIASSLAGIIVVQSKTGELQYYPQLGLVVIGFILITLILMFNLNKHLSKNAEVSPSINPTAEGS